MRELTYSDVQMDGKSSTEGSLRIKDNPVEARTGDNVSEVNVSQYHRQASNI
jgi:hypothetical protein